MARPSRRWPTRSPRPARWPSAASVPSFLADAGGVEKLPPDYREVFVLRNIEHIPFNEIAVRMSRSPGAARVLWTRAMQRLSQLLEEKEP